MQWEPDLWNSLPRDIVNAGSSHKFNRKLGKFWE